MSSEDRPGAFEEFQGLVLRDPALQAVVRSRLAEAADVAGARALLVALGARQGLAFTEAEVMAAERRARRVWLERWVRA